MRVTLLSVLIILFGEILHAQTKAPLPSIPELKAKLILLEKGFPDIKRKLLKSKPADPLTQELTVKMGDFGGRYNGSGERPSIEYTFSDYKYSGSIETFQAFYRKLLDVIKQVFGNVYKLIEYSPEEREWSATFDEQAAPKYKSPTNIFVQCNWGLNHPKVSLTFFGNKTGQEQ